MVRKLSRYWSYSPGPVYIVHLIIPHRSDKFAPRQRILHHRSKKPGRLHVNPETIETSAGGIDQSVSRPRVTSTSKNQRVKDGERMGSDDPIPDSIGPIYVRGSLQSSPDADARIRRAGVDALLSRNRINVRDFSSRMYR